MRLPMLKKFTAALCLAFSSSAFPATFSAVGDALSVGYTGNSPGLTATTSYQLLAIADAGRSWTFLGSLDNTSYLSSRISIAGFNTSGLVDLSGSGASGGFSQVGAGAMPGGNSVDFCVKNVGGSNCAGGGGSGVGNSDDPLLFSFTISLQQATDSLELGDFAVRFQSVGGPGNMAFAAYENFTPSAVPLPAAGWLMLSALAGLGATNWRRRK